MYVEVKEALTKSLDDDDLASVIRILPEEVADLGLATYIKPALEPTKAEKETSRQPLTRGEPCLPGSPTSDCVKHFKFKLTGAQTRLCRALTLCL